MNIPKSKGIKWVKRYLIRANGKNRPGEGPALYQAAEQALHVWGEENLKRTKGHQKVGGAQTCWDMPDTGYATDPSQETTGRPQVQILSHVETDSVSWTTKERTLKESPE